MSEEISEAPAFDSFCDEGLIVEVLGLLKTGKEASVYCCRAHPRTGADLLAAKVYRERKYRTFRNDSLYQEGRYIRDARLRRAWRNRTETGREIEFARWTGHEFATLTTLYAAGADVPRPMAHSGPTVLMEYVGDAEAAAPLLKNVHLSRREAASLFARILHNLELFLSCDLVHADLSPFNILYWNHAPKIIDFPQAVNVWTNRNAFDLLSRDIANLCHYFSRRSVEVDPLPLAEDLWRRFVGIDPWMAWG